MKPAVFLTTAASVFASFLLLGSDVVSAQHTANGADSTGTAVPAGGSSGGSSSSSGGGSGGDSGSSGNSSSGGNSISGGGSGRFVPAAIGGHRAANGDPSSKL